ncbi:MAG: AlpA family phage regulatory protein [bacterium]|nr:AlpA family phage regulatory protein [bacterium]
MADDTPAMVRARRRRELIGSTEVARLLGISRRHLYRRMLEPGFPQGFKSGPSDKSRRQWRRGDVEDYIESCTRLDMERRGLA